MTIESIDKRLKQTEISKRKDYLIRQLNKLGVYKSVDGRGLTELSLYSLEWMNIQEKNKTVKG